MGRAAVAWVTQSVSGPGSSNAASQGSAAAVAKKKQESALTDPALAYARQDHLTAAAQLALNWSRPWWRCGRSSLRVF